MTLNVKRILAAVDFSETSDKAFDYALSFARVFEAEVVALYVLDDPFLYASYTDQSFRDPLERSVQTQLDSLVNRHGSEGVTVKTAKLPGAPFYEIIQYAEREHCDLIVLGSHGHGPMKHMLLGSVAEKVVRKAKCPVLVVRPDQHQFVRP